jgi:hypothetical protein
MVNEQDYVGVHADAKTVYVLIASREKFDDIPLPVQERDDRVHGNGLVLSKMLVTPELWVVFQHWLEDLDPTKNE